MPAPFPGSRRRTWALEQAAAGLPEADNRRKRIQAHGNGLNGTEVVPAAPETTAEGRHHKQGAAGVGYFKQNAKRNGPSYNYIQPGL